MDQRLTARQGLSSSQKGFILVAIGAAFWGFGPMFRLLVMEQLTSSQIVFLEHVVLLVYAAPVLWLHRKELRNLSWRHVAALLFISWGGSVAATIMFTEAFAHGNHNTVLLLQKLQPLFAVVLARLVLKEHLPKLFGGLLVVAMAGTYLLTFGFSLPQGNIGDVVGISSMLALGAAFLWGGSTVMGRYMLGRMEYETVTALRFVLALPLLGILIWSEQAPWNVAAAEMGSTTFYIVVQALLLGLVSLLFYYKGLSTTKASYATLAELSFPIVGVILNWTVYGETITVAQTIGFVMIWLAMLVVSNQRQ